ncbi:hypothetical protein [Kribbella speibonae]|uniref:DUF1579 domain-containing protein n=1 Tax=Kribbella speibonae TaxID=1572660 RepID=A0A4R0J987_9ACTN|nr:hypothetical protein [Kribbella speibonae]TCC16585.1 hypothetical protein E0H58_39615 [Kribbella speibonae]TCC41894.1 hypothetical protein E0H92_09730 [Kribbella speibonae]
MSKSSLQSLAPLVGTWSIGGPGHSGTVRYEWFENESFLVQHIDIVSDGESTRGIEYIGVDPDTGTLRSHFYGTNGKILEYTYELSDDTLTIWFGGPDSPAKFVGRFNADRTVNSGAWQWPGGGYESTMTRVEGEAR